MRLLCSFIFLAIHLFAQPQIDRIYGFSNYSQSKKAQDSKKLSLGVLFEGSSSLNNTDFFSSIVILHMKDFHSNEQNNVDIRELYLKRYFHDDIYSVSFGREISNFSVSKTHSLVDFFTKKNEVTNSSDRTLKQLGQDGFNLVYENNFKMALYMYDLNKGSSNGIIEVSKTYKNTALSFYFNKNLQALTLSSGLNDYFNFNSEFKYEKDQSNMIFAIDYTPVREVSISLEKIYLNSEENKEDRIHTLKNIFNKTQDERDNYFNSLTSKEYTNIYLRYTKDNLEASLFYTLNNTDNSKRYVSSLKYDFEHFSFISEYLLNYGAKNSQYSDNLMKNKISFHISWEYLK
ncbi:MAG: hypothetical protein GY932_07620 [Arcobacter sp.]|nr:hypothetical protein [Arcobacter sp.]